MKKNKKIAKALMKLLADKLSGKISEQEFEDKYKKLTSTDRSRT